MAAELHSLSPALSPALAARLSAEQAGTESLGEDALALRFVDRYLDQYRFAPSWGWMANLGTHWARDTRLGHFDDARALCRELAVPLEPEKGESKRLGSAKTVAAVIQLAHADQRIVAVPAEFDVDRMALNTPGGIVNLRNGTTRPHNSELFTKITRVAPDMDATPVAWFRFLDQVFQGDADVIAFVQRLLGYFATAEVREQVIAFFHGEGGNGKSTLLDILLGLLGAYAIKVPTAMLMAQRGERHPTDVAQLCGSRLAVANEITEGESWDESKVKELTGDATLTARFMRQDYFNFEATHKFVIAANHRPQMRTMDHAMRRRLLLVPFNARFEGSNRDPDMLLKLRAEGPAILGWIIAGAVDWHANGLGVPHSVREASTEYADAMDSLGLWMTECCLRTGDPFDSEGASALYGSYAAWKRSRGESPVSATRFGEQMRSRGFEAYRNNGNRYRAIELTQDERDRMIAASQLNGTLK